MMRTRYSASRGRPLACLLLAFAVTASGAALGGDGPSASDAPDGSASTPAAALTASQREAATLLRSMTAYLASLKTFTFAFRDGYDVVQSTGQKIEFGETRRITMARPDRLRVEEVSSHDT